MTTTHAEAHVHRDPPAVVARRDRMGVLLLIVADIAFVLSLIFSYLYLRFLNVNGLWLPEEVQPAEVSLTWIINLVLLVGVISAVLASRGARAGRQGSLVSASLVALLVAVVAFVLQWHQLATFGFPAAENGYFASAYSSAIVILAGANAFHLLLTVFISLGIAIRAKRGLFTDPGAWQPRLAMYWWTWVLLSSVIVALMTTFFVQTPYPPSMDGL